MTSWQNIDTFDHELDRVTSMTDEQLTARYHKMKKIEKIEALQRALIRENRNPSLQQTVKAHLAKNMRHVANEWVLSRDDDTWTFQKYDDDNIQVFRNYVVHDIKYANGYYSTAQARALWEKLSQNGYA